ncbi:MAG: hypothetical protein QM742_07685 [Aquabacterium sp.]
MGWVGLRLLGLAAGFRLYDTERGEYVRGKTLLNLVERAFMRVCRRYAVTSDGTLGTPCVDLVTRPWGTAMLFGFDGGQRKLNEQERARLMDDELLATVQIALRPMPDGLLRGAASTHWVQYRYVELPKASHAIVLQPDLQDGKTEWPAFYDVVELGRLLHVQADAGGLGHRSLEDRAVGTCAPVRHSRGPA